MRAKRADVAIVGAGPAGIAAAIGAARQGARVIIIERNKNLGGNATTAMVGTICGISRCGRELHEPPRFDNPGFAGEFSRRVAERSRTALIRDQLGLAYLPYSPSVFEEVCQEIVAEHQTIQAITRAALSTASRGKDGDGFSLRLTTSLESDVEIQASSLIDCSGDSVALELLNLPVVTPSRTQAAALVFTIKGVPRTDERTLSFTIRKALREAVLDGILPADLSNVSMVPGSYRGDEALFKLGLTTFSLSAARTSEGQPTETIYREAAAFLEPIVSCVRARGNGLESISLAGIAPAVGMRSGRRGLGEEELSTEAVRFSQRHINGIALGLWPVEIWDTPVRPELTFPERGDGYEIPLGSLCAKGVDGIYFAGRAIAATDHAIGSARVIGTSLSTGYAAGWLAAGRLQGQSMDVIVSALRAEQVNSFYSDETTAR